MTRLVVAYDAEKSGACLPAARALVALHERLGVPATWFIVGELLEQEPEWKRLLDNPLFEVASHGYRHRLLRPAPNGDPAVSNAERWEELVLGKDAVEQAFGRECLGLRIPNGHPQGLGGDEWLQQRVKQAGYRYSASQVYQGHQFYPGPYSAALWELPATGKHDTHLWAEQGGRTDGAQGLLFKMEYRGGLLSAMKDRVPYTSFIWHPWQLTQFDATMAHVDGVLTAARTWRMELGTFAQEYARVAQREEIPA